MTTRKGLLPRRLAGRLQPLLQRCQRRRRLCLGVGRRWRLLRLLRLKAPTRQLPALVCLLQRLAHRCRLFDPGKSRRLRLQLMLLARQLATCPM